MEFCPTKYEKKGDWEIRRPKEAHTGLGGDAVETDGKNGGFTRRRKEIRVLLQSLRLLRALSVKLSFA